MMGVLVELVEQRGCWVTGKVKLPSRIRRRISNRDSVHQVDVDRTAACGGRRVSARPWPLMEVLVFLDCGRCNTGRLMRDSLEAAMVLHILLALTEAHPP